MIIVIRYGSPQLHGEADKKLENFKRVCQK